jgi:hypothetical protein
MTQTPEPINASKEIGEWLAAWANGEAKDQNTAFLDKIVKQKVDAEIAKRPKPKEGGRVQNPDGIIKSFVASFTQGPVPSTAFGGAAGTINKLLDQAAETARQHERDAGATKIQGIGAGDDAFIGVLEEKVTTLEAQVERYDGELARAHEWRFHLEARAREVHGTVHHLLKIVKRAPSREEMEGIVDTLKEAIGWAP